MSFVYSKFLIPLIVLICFTILLIIRQERNYFSWVKKFWFYKRSLASKLSSFFFIAGIVLLALSTLDLRGPEETITGDIPDQKTLILIDTSSSMLAEDVRPNRFEKAIILARHFVKKAVGHQISVALFSDATIPSTPFTDDISFLDSKLGALSSLNLRRGGTSLINSIHEGIQILRAHEGGKSVSGNILVFTDSEDHGDTSELRVPETVNVAVVGVGTVAGERIPIKSKKGEFLHYKKYQGKEITTKLDETKIKKLGSYIKNFRYWVALSYSVPTEEITKFFRNQFKKTLAKGEMKIRPVLASWLLIPAIALLTLSFAFSVPGSFVAITLLVLFSLYGTTNSIAQELDSPPPKEKPLSDTHLELLQKSMKGKASNSEQLKLAEELLRAGKVNESLTLYEENLREKSDDKAYFNYGTALLKSGSKLKGVQVLRDLKYKVEAGNADKELLETIRHNIKLAFQINPKQKQQKKKKEEKQDKEKKKDKEEKQNKDKKQDKDKKKEKKNEQKKKNDQEQNKKDQNKNEKGKGEQSKKDPKENKQDKKKQKGSKDGKQKQSDRKPEKKEKKLKSKLKQLEAKEQKIKKHRKMKRTPGIVKQIMDDDQNIMRMLMDTSRPKGSSDAKDW